MFTDHVIGPVVHGLRSCYTVSFCTIEIVQLQPVGKLPAFLENLFHRKNVFIFVEKREMMIDAE